MNGPWNRRSARSKGEKQGRPTPRRIRTLTAWPSAVEITRLDAGRLRFRIEGGGYSGGLGWLFRGPQSPLFEGEAIRMGRFEASVVELTDDARPAVVDFHFAGSLESPTYRWVQFLDGIYEPFEPPELGQTVRLEAPRGPLEMEGAEMVGNYRRAKARLEGR